MDVSAVKVKTFAELMDEAPSKGKASEAKVKVDAKPVDVSAVKVKIFAELMAEKMAAAAAADASPFELVLFFSRQKNLAA